MTARRHHRLQTVLRAGLREQRAALALALLAMASVVATELLAPWPLKVLFDHVLLGKPLPPSLAMLQPLLDLGAWPALLALAAAIAGLAFGGGALAWLQLYSSARVGHRITWRLRGALFAHLQQLSLAYHRGHRSGELITKVAADTNLLRDLFADWLLTFLRQVLTVLAMGVVMAMINPWLAAVVATTLPPLLAVIFLLNRRVKATVREQRRSDGRMVSRLNELLSAIALVKAFGRHQHEQARFGAEIEASYHAGLRNARAAGAVARAVAALTALGTAVTVLLGAREVLAGRLSPGELLVFMAYVASLYKPVRDLARLSSKLARAGVSLQRLGEILDTEPDADDPPDALDLPDGGGEIVFEDVSFAYPGGAPVFEHLSLRIAAGEHVALTGPSGAGKSTLVGLLLRLYEPSAGRILIDGIDIRRYRRQGLRDAIGLVPQETLLFAVPVRENIAYGRPDASDAEIEAAARLARAHEFIVDLPQGYDTELAERATNLSGGQRQRLCLARALLKRPLLLVMDEPTSAIDAPSARLIHEAVAHAQRGRTLLVITHEAAGLSRYDRVVTLGARTVRAPAIPPARPETRHA